MPDTVFDCILFDLDGTLSDSGPGIMHSVRYALAKYGITEDDDAALRKFVGPPLVYAFREFYGFSEAQAKEALAYYREDYLAGAIFMNTPYAGMEETLIQLQNAGKILAVATGKPTPMAEMVLRRFNWSRYFSFVSGSTLDESRSAKREIIEYALEALHMKDRSRVLMVGDRDNDILAAKVCGIASCGALYGYGSREELEDAGAALLIRAPKELLPLV